MQLDIIEPMEGLSYRASIWPSPCGEGFCEPTPQGPLVLAVMWPMREDRLDVTALLGNMKVGGPDWFPPWVWLRLVDAQEQQLVKIAKEWPTARHDVRVIGGYPNFSPCRDNLFTKLVQSYPRQDQVRIRESLRFIESPVHHCLGSNFWED